MKARIPDGQPSVKRASTAHYLARNMIANSETDALCNATLEVIKRELREEIFHDQMTNLTAQLLSVMLETLAVCYGWKRKRLLKYVENMQSFGDLIFTGVFGKTANAIDCYNHIKSDYGIDTAEIAKKWLDK